MKSNLSRWGLSRYYITKEGILYFKTLNKGWVKKPFRLLESKKEEEVYSITFERRRQICLWVFT
jgi:hypothetical protein